MKIEGVILAAGLSSRMGSNKLLLNVLEMPMIERVILNMLPFCERLIVVLGHDGHKLEPLLKKYDTVKLVYNSGYQSGMFSSVKVGCEHLKGDRFFLTPADMPLISKDTYKCLLEVNDSVVIPSYQGKAGHPILLNIEVAEGLRTRDRQSSAESRPSIESRPITEAQNLREYLNDFHKTYVSVPDEGILMDIDTRTVYDKLKEGGLI